MQRKKATYVTLTRDTQFYLPAGGRVLTTRLSVGMPFLDGNLFKYMNFFITATQLRFSMVHFYNVFSIYMLYSVTKSCELNVKSNHHVRSPSAFTIGHANNLSVT